MMVQKVIRDGKVAVLVSSGFGAGWSTWIGDKHQEASLFDHRLVRAAEAGVTDVDDLAREVFGESHVCIIGWRDIAIEWLPVGTEFFIDEYDGSETIVLIDDVRIIA